MDVIVFPSTEAITADAPDPSVSRSSIINLLPTLNVAGESSIFKLLTLPEIVLLTLRIDSEPLLSIDDVLNLFALAEDHLE